VAIERIDDSGDPRIAEYTGMTDRELLRARGLFVAEGRLVVQRVLAEHCLSVRSLLLSDAAHHALAADLRRLAAGIPIYLCRLEMFERITGHDIHRGCLALVERPPAAAIDEVVGCARLIVALEAVADADNVGGVFRNALAFGADAVLLSPSCCDPLYRKAIRTSMAAALAVPFARVAEWPGGLVPLKARGFVVVALTPRADLDATRKARAETLDSFADGPRPDRLVLVAGAEGQGLSDAALALADVRVRIPMQPGVDSLNLAVALGIALSRLGRPAD
jgi:tRNA G18 (ribose-2'-O)-methylase SpoU